jgi:UDP-3-O-[3-hydroxymyristoyl] glucosamine N-acyltransferase
MTCSSVDQNHWTTHINPDGTEGGRVSPTASVGTNVTIGRTARVFAGAVVPDNAVLELGVFYTSEGPIEFR